MEFDVCLDELRDLQLPETEWELRVKWSYDSDYSPKEGLYQKYEFELQKFVGDKWVDITDELSSFDFAKIVRLIEENDNDDILWNVWSCGIRSFHAIACWASLDAISKGRDCPSHQQEEKSLKGVFKAS